MSGDVEPWEVSRQKILQGNVPVEDICRAMLAYVLQEEQAAVIRAALALKFPVDLSGEGLVDLSVRLTPREGDNGMQWTITVPCTAAQMVDDVCDFVGDMIEHDDDATIDVHVIYSSWHVNGQIKLWKG